MHKTLLGVGLLAAACNATSSSSPDAGTPDAATKGPAKAILKITTPDSTDFYGIPFPNDLHLAADGTVDLTNLPRPTPVLAQYFDTFQTTKGFSTNGAVVFRFDGQLDPSSFPQTPEDSLADGASIYLVDVTKTSPDYGKKWPVRERFEHWQQMTIGQNWLSVLPYAGFPLDPLTTYAVVVTNKVKATDGSAVQRPADLDAIFGAASSDPAIQKAQQVYQPLLDWLDEPGGDERADVAIASVFTTQDPTSLMGKIRTVVMALPTPSPENPPVHDSGQDTNDYQVWEGTYSAPNFQTGLPPYIDGGGEIVSDDTGMPIVQRMESIRFAITIPKQFTMPGKGWPICLYAHGTGGDYMSFIYDGTGGRLAQQGIATISIDQVLHGPRVPGASNPEINFFNVFNPVAARDNTRQGAADNFQLERLAWNLNIAGNTFDQNTEFFFGHSQGGLTGPPFIAYEPQIKAAVLSGAGGLIYIALLEKTAPTDITALVKGVDRDYPLDEFDPILSMVQMYMEPSDPVNYGPLMFRNVPAGRTPISIFQSDGKIDHYAPPDGIEAFGTSMGLQPIAPLVDPMMPEGFKLRGWTLGTAPISGNVGTGVTGVFLQYTSAPGSDGHFVVFDVPAAEAQSAQFLGTAVKGTAILVSYP